MGNKSNQEKYKLAVQYLRERRISLLYDNFTPTSSAATNVSATFERYKQQTKSLVEISRE